MKSELINVRPDARKESNGCNGTLEREEWRDVVGYEGLYQVSSFGRVKSLDRIIHYPSGKIYHLTEKILTNRRDNYGYEYVGFYKDGKAKNFKVHRLVADAFVPNPDNLPQVNHRNEDKTCNVPDNLEHCTQLYNMNYGTLRKRSVAEWKKHYTKERHGMYGKHHTDEARKKMSDAVIERLSDKTNHPLYGKHHSDETKSKISKANSIPIVQLDPITGELIKEWEGAAQAARELPISSTAIAYCCKGVTQHCCGFKWKYKSDYENEQRQ